MQSLYFCSYQAAVVGGDTNRCFWIPSEQIRKPIAQTPYSNSQNPSFHFRRPKAGENLIKTFGGKLSLN